MSEIPRFSNIKSLGEVADPVRPYDIANRHWVLEQISGGPVTVRHIETMSVLWLLNPVHGANYYGSFFGGAGGSALDASRPAQAVTHPYAFDIEFAQIEIEALAGATAPINTIIRLQPNWTTNSIELGVTSVPQRKFFTKEQINIQTAPGNSSMEVQVTNLPPPNQVYWVSVMAGISFHYSDVVPPEPSPRGALVDYSLGPGELPE